MNVSTARSRVAVALIGALLANCVVRGPVNVKPVSPAEGVQVRTAVKAHLADGSTIVYPNGVTVANGKLLGAGTRYDLTLANSGQVGEVLLSDVIALESFEDTTNKPMTALASGGATVALIVGAALLAVAIFGSCPTVYADVEGDQKLEAELFSYSIAPLFEATDVDPLRAQASADGRIALHVRNEALETHYLNQLDVLEVRHGAGETIVPDQDGKPVALSALSTPSSIKDRRGRDLREALDSRDGRFFSTDPATLRTAKKGDLRDWIELEVPVEAGQSEAAFLFTLRNSLLNTVLFYDVMLAGAGAKSLDWLKNDLNQIGPALTLGSWYSSQMGMRIEVWQDGMYREVAHVGDSGPIAWKDMAVTVPVPRGERLLRVRLSFIVDNWRIDQVRVAATVRRPDVRRVKAADVITADGSHNAAAVRSVSAIDNNYLQTTPGQSFTLMFDVGAATPDVHRTLLFESRGYYTEWIRTSWVARDNPAVFVPGDDALLEALNRWRNIQPDFESRFEATRIPVR
jgi:hypothetical protein